MTARAAIDLEDLGGPTPNLSPQRIAT